MKHKLFFKMGPAALLISGCLGYAQQSPTPLGVQELQNVDGSNNPDLIPDVVAYSHLFAVLTTRRESAVVDEARRRSYLQYFFGPSCSMLNNEDHSLSETQVQRLLSVVDALSPGLLELDQWALTIVGTGKQLGSDAMAQLAWLQAEHDRRVIDAVQALPGAIGADGAAKVRSHVVQHMKAHIRTVTISVPMIGPH